MKASHRQIKALRIVALVAAFGLLVPTTEATCVVVLMDEKHNQIFIATDCKVVAYEGGSSTACKLVIEPGCVATMAGQYGNVATKFFLHDLVTQACTARGDLAAKAESFARLAPIRYQAAALWTMEHNRQGFRDRYVNNGTDVIFAGVEAGRARLIAISMKADERGVVAVQSFKESDQYFSGVNDHITEYVNSHPSWMSEGYVKAARQLVSMEIKAHADIDLLFLVDAADRAALQRPRRIFSSHQLAFDSVPEDAAPLEYRISELGTSRLRWLRSQRGCITSSRESRTPLQ